jgi:hypothetical protein
MRNSSSVVDLNIASSSDTARSKAAPKQGMGKAMPISDSRDRANKGVVFDLVSTLIVSRVYSVRGMPEGVVVIVGVNPRANL